MGLFDAFRASKESKVARTLFELGNTAGYLVGKAAIIDTGFTGRWNQLELRAFEYSFSMYYLYFFLFSGGVPFDSDEVERLLILEVVKNHVKEAKERAKGGGFPEKEIVTELLATMLARWEEYRESVHFGEGGFGFVNTVDTVLRYMGRDTGEAEALAGNSVMAGMVVNELFTDAVSKKAKYLG